MHKVLLAVDGSSHSDQAVRHVIDFARAYGPIEVHLINVEPEPVVWQTHGMEQAAVEAHLAALSHRSMKSAQTLLSEAEMPSHAHSKVGDIAATIAATAEKLRCDAIVMGTRGLGAVAGLALGSVTRKVLHLAQVPVVCVK